MEWLTCLREAIRYMEDHLEDDISVQDVAEHVHLSPFFLQRGFSLLTGFGIGEYLRNRRLYRAALEFRDTKNKVIDVALRYGYETQESFAKAFARFHGATPAQVRGGAAVNVFLPLQIDLSIRGGYQMDYRITPMFPFKLIGFQRIFDVEDSYARIPEYWDEIFKTYAGSAYTGKAPANPMEQAFVDNGIGEYGVCIDDIGEGKFRYLIAGKYTGGAVPEGMVVYEFPRSDWAVFSCVGPNPDTLQRVNTQIYREWLPGHPEFELCGCATVEWYDCINGVMTDPDYHSAIWLPIRKKTALNDNG